ncbi:hypothetical protein CEXT_708441 [Caerostris extrusa]|uniref:Uncharacterized protein n=1 Tax=Caerostris extrusa TaxID=172846 RepID=A0AAV4SYK0_CAEEX|nr:hypothetical protein CEXT_708441 [Caerostris extrusa]
MQKLSLCRCILVREKSIPDVQKVSRKILGKEQSSLSPRYCENYGDDEEEELKRWQVRRNEGTYPHVFLYERNRKYPHPSPQMSEKASPPLLGLIKCRGQRLPMMEPLGL